MLPAALIALAAGQDWVISRQQALMSGLTAKQWDSRLRGTLTPLMSGTAFVHTPDGPAAPGPRARGRAVLLKTSDPAATLSHGSVLRLHDCQGTPAQDAEHVTVSTGGWHPNVDVRRHRRSLASVERECLDGLPVTSLSRALTDSVRSYDRAHAVSVLDSACHLSLVQLSDLSTICAPLGLMRQGWLALVDALAESPFETRARLFFGDHKLAWQSQVPLHLDGFGLVRLDFLLGRRLAVECDGVSVHDTPQARFRDRAREDALRAAGYEVLRVTWADLEFRPAETLARILAALTRCG